MDLLGIVLLLGLSLNHHKFNISFPICRTIDLRQTGLHLIAVIDDMADDLAVARLRVSVRHIF